MYTIAQMCVCKQFWHAQNSGVQNMYANTLLLIQKIGHVNFLPSGLTKWCLNVTYLLVAALEYQCKLILFKKRCNKVFLN